MNRRDRRNASKRLGIMEYQRKLPRNKRFELMRENIISGKQQDQEFKERVKQQISEQEEEKESQIVYNLAEKIAKYKKIPVIDAMAEAQAEYNKSRNK